jgi:hypothetical protein
MVFNQHNTIFTLNMQLYFKVQPHLGMFICTHVKHSKKFPSAFGWHLIPNNTAHKKQEALYA